MREIGANTNRLIDNLDNTQRYTGMTPQSAIPVYITRTGGERRMSTRPFRFGLQAFNPKSPEAWREMVRKTEDLGYSAYHLADHFLGPGPAIESTGHPPQLIGAVPAMAMALEMTSTPEGGCTGVLHGLP